MHRFGSIRDDRIIEWDHKKKKKVAFILIELNRIHL